MNGKKTLLFFVALLLSCLGTTTRADAHITPPVVLVSDRDAVVALTTGARRYFVREAQLTDDELATIQKQWGWRPDEDFYRFYVGRDSQGNLISAVAFLTEYTIHGPVRVAVGLGADGKVKGALVVELTEETYPWLRPLIDQKFTHDYVGQDSGAGFGIGERFQKVGLGDMQHFYAQIVASLIQRCAILFETTVLERSR